MVDLRKDQLLHLVIAAASVFLTISLILYPEHAFAAAVDGLTIWWEVVFPALLPFFIGAEILIGLGVVHFMGVILEPFMRPIFNVPGAGSFVMAVGLASGFPIGSILTSKLRKDRMLSKTEAERLLCFTNTADPLFMFGAVAVGMFNNASLGILIATAHYLSSISVGLMMRFYKKNSPDMTKEKSTNEHIIIRAFKALFKARKDDNRTMGKLLGDAIRNSVNTLLLVGGFIILFSVIIRILTVVGVITTLKAMITPVFLFLGLHPELIPALISGFFEISLGCEIAGALPASIPMAQKLMAVGAVIAWSGLSVHAQVASITSDTDINVKPFILARVIHGTLAALYTIPVVKYLHQPIEPVISKPGLQLMELNNWELSLLMILIVLVGLTLLTLIVSIFQVMNSCRRIVAWKIKGFY